ncbi:MAG: hypothetical protein BRC26_02290, partial [Nanohaloarchaea archaeon QH_8_44_6]
MSGPVGVNMGRAKLSDTSDEFRKNLYFIGASLLLVGLAAAGHNVLTPNNPKDVGYTEVNTNCVGLDAGLCLGLQRQTYTTYNYDNYTEVEEGTENY